MKDKDIWVSEDECKAVIKKSYGPYFFSTNKDSFIVSSDDTKQIADAIYTELGLGWLPYPENKPEHQGDYYIQFKMGGHMIAEWDEAREEFTNGVLPCDAIAYRELPAPYNPGAADD